MLWLFSDGFHDKLHSGEPGKLLFCRAYGAYLITRRYGDGTKYHDAGSRRAVFKQVVYYLLSHRVFDSRDENVRLWLDEPKFHSPPNSWR